MNKMIPLLMSSLFSIIAVGCTSGRSQIESSQEMQGFQKGITLSQGLQGQAWCLEPARKKTAVFRRDGSLYVRTVTSQGEGSGDEAGSNPGGHSMVEQSEYFWRTAPNSDTDAILISEDEIHWNRYPLAVMLLRTGETRVSINGESWISCP